VHVSVTRFPLSFPVMISAFRIEVSQYYVCGKCGESAYILRLQKDAQLREQTKVIIRDYVIVIGARIQQMIVHKLLGLS